MDFARLAQVAGRFVSEQLARQEGFPIAFKAAIVRTRSGDYLVRLGSGEKPSFERIDRLPSADGGFGPSLAHPPTFDLRDSIEDLKFPLRIPYSSMAMPLAGRGGQIVIHGDGRIEDEIFWMS